MSKKIYTRKIKCNGTCIPAGKKGFSYEHMYFYDNTKSDKAICTGFDYDKEGNWAGGKYIDNCPKKTLKELIKYMEIPYVNLSFDSILNFYKINNIEDLINLVDRYINRKEPEKNVLRIVNVWIIENLNELSRLNSQMVEMFWNIKQSFWTDIDLDHSKFEKITKKYFLKWNSKRKDEFYLNFPEDLYNHLKTV